VRHGGLRRYPSPWIYASATRLGLHKICEGMSPAFDITSKGITPLSRLCNADKACAIQACTRLVTGRKAEIGEAKSYWGGSDVLLQERYFDGFVRVVDDYRQA
jgi:hypothetical protein